MECKLCESASHYNPGLIGENSDKTKLMIVLHRADRRISEYLEGYWGALANSATGTILDKMLKRAALDLSDIYLTSLFKCLLPEDRHPKRQEYRNCLSVFERQVGEFHPRGMVVFGNEPYKHIFPEQSGEIKIADLGRELSYQGTPVLVSIHPSQIWKKRNPQLQEPYIKRVADFLTKYKS